VVRLTILYNYNRRIGLSGFNRNIRQSLNVIKRQLLVMDSTKDWQALINKPVTSSDAREIGVVSDIQPLHIIVSSGAVTPKKYNIPKELVDEFENGIVRVNLSQRDVQDNYKFE
jgi:sporulation protein YlmC with PRC-barrel domain